MLVCECVGEGFLACNPNNTIFCTHNGYCIWAAVSPEPIYCCDHLSMCQGYYTHRSCVCHVYDTRHAHVTPMTHVADMSRLLHPHVIHVLRLSHTSCVCHGYGTKVIHVSWAMALLSGEESLQPRRCRGFNTIGHTCSRI